MSGIPKFFLYNERPTKVVERDGGWDVVGLDMETGEWEDDDEFLDRYFQRDGEIMVVTEEEFNAAVAAIRKDLGVETR
jgi:hypothetical protein